VSVDFMDLERVLRRLDAAEEVVKEARLLPRGAWTNGLAYTVETYCEHVANDHGALRRVRTDNRYG